MTVPSAEPDGCMFFVILSLAAPEGSTNSDSGLKRLRRRGHSLRLVRQTVRAGKRSRDPGIQGEWLHHGSNKKCICLTRPSRFCYLSYMWHFIL